MGGPSPGHARATALLGAGDIYHHSQSAKQCFGWRCCIKPLERHPESFFSWNEKFWDSKQRQQGCPTFLARLQFVNDNFTFTHSLCNFNCKTYTCVPLEFMGGCSVVIHVCHADSQNKVNFSGRAEGCALSFFHSEIPYTGKTLCLHVTPSGKDFWMSWDHRKALCLLKQLCQLNHIKWRCGFYRNILLPSWFI